MAKYKITNITNTLGKRDGKYNKVVDVQYIGGIERKSVGIIPGDTLFIELKHLPIDIQRLKLNGYIIVEQISDVQYDNEKKIKEQGKPIEQVVIEVVEPIVVIDSDDESLIEKPTKKAPK